MGLEDGGNLTVLIQLTDAAGTLQNLLRLVGVVAEEYQLVVLNLEIETTLYPSVCLHAVAQLLGGTASKLCHSHGGNAVLYINRYGLS